MSADDRKSVVMKGVIHGARDYLIKPLRFESVENIWQHIVRPNKDEWKDKILDQPEEVEYSCVANEGRLKSSKKRTEERSDTAILKKARMVWSPELRIKFIQAVNHLGIDSMNHFTFLLDICTNFYFVDVILCCSNCLVILHQHFHFIHMIPRHHIFRLITQILCVFQSRMCNQSVTIIPDRQLLLAELSLL